MDSCIVFPQIFISSQPLTNHSFLCCPVTGQNGCWKSNGEGDYALNKISRDLKDEVEILGSGGAIELCGKFIVARSVYILGEV
jgi:hypothetical protein